MNNIQYENRLQEIKNNIESYKLKIEFLKTLRIKTKKNGEPFAKMENNFEFEGFSTNIVKETIGLNGYDYKIYFHNPKTMQSGNLQIRGYRNLDYNYKAQEYTIPEGIAADRVIKQRYTVPYYILNFEELKAEFKQMELNCIGYLAREEKHLQELTIAKDDILKFEKEIKEKYPTLSWYDLEKVVYI